MNKKYDSHGVHGTQEGPGSELVLQHRTGQLFWKISHLLMGAFYAISSLLNPYPALTLTLRSHDQPYDTLSQ